MKVKELIDKLKELDQDKEVIYDGNGSQREIKWVEYDKYTDEVGIW